MASSPELCRVADDLLARTEDLVDVQLRAVRSIESYSDIPATELRTSGRRNVARVAWALRGQDPAAPPFEETEQSTGRHRALQGIPVEDVVAAYRVVMGALREEFLRAARAHGVRAEDVVAAMRVLWELTDRYSAELVTARHHIDVEVIRRDERARMEFVQRVMTGALLPAEIVMAGAGYGLLADGEYWVSRGRPDGDRTAFVRRLEAAGAGEHLRPLVGWVEGDVVAVTASRPAIATAGGVLAVSGPTTPTGFPRAFAESTRLLNVATRYRHSGLVDSSTLSIRIAVVEEDELSAALVARYVEPVLATGSGAAVILATVRAHLGGRRHFPDTAAALSVHANTVRYRLARFVELTGADLEQTETLFEVWWALESWSLRAPEG